MGLVLKSSLIPAFLRLRKENTNCLIISNGSIKLYSNQGKLTLSPCEITDIFEEKQWGFWRKITLLVNERTFTIPWVPRGRARQLKSAIALTELFEALQPWFLGNHYVPFSELECWRKTAGNKLIQRCSGIPMSFMEECLGEKYAKDLFLLIRNPESFRAKVNQHFYEKAKINFRQLFVDLSLSEEQQEAVLTDDDVTLVIAPAGSGKTHTLRGKIVYLIKTGLARPDEILAVCFNVKASEELKRRVCEKLGEEIASKITIRTFHSLSWHILKEVEGREPVISDLADDEYKMLAWLTDCYQNLIKCDDEIARAFLEFITYHQHEKTYLDFTSQEEYETYIKRVQPRTLKGDLVRSYEECLIANFLYVNNIEYKYEHPYPFANSYNPDFYLPQYDIYIEHFAISKDGRVAPFIDANKYLADMEWKRRVHQENKTKLIETYSWQVREGVIFEHLAAKLKEHGVALVYNSLEREAVENVLNNLKRLGYATSFSELLQACLNLYKSSRIKKPAETYRERCFMKIFERVLAEYEKALKVNNEVDFHDLIIKAIEYIETGKYIPRYKYIIVDEFQDVTPALGELLKALRDHRNGARLFCVGDDWQSIYRFTGADVSLMQNIEVFFGYAARKFLKTSYRLNNCIAHVSSKFIQKNPKQIKKEIITLKKVAEPRIFIMRMTRPRIGSDEEGPLIRALRFIDRLAESEKSNFEKATVMILARYTEQNMMRAYDWLEHELEILKRRAERKLRHISILVGLQSGKRQYIRSVHSVKGLEADYVVIFGVKSGPYGFPCEIRDDPVLRLFAAEGEDYPYAEERRVFYVALTRARRAVVILADGLHKRANMEGERTSIFLEEIAEDSPDQIYGGQRCPACRIGKLVVYFNVNAEEGFLGCSHYPTCKFKLPMQAHKHRSHAETRRRF